ncbi:cytochrome P450 [Polyplosphaeria fusca]|uniref:Cytochrome P450 n=1 Tax=Polyplosphaeria fusca TaxID=682080 RepID=A0A9P4QTN4_9PLEO|nr:cytochrome P450 [Polyplosphaeria fusca]
MSATTYLVLAIAFPTWYKLYQNFYERGRFIFEIEQLHKRHGPVVRISANDLHVNDPEIFLEITRIRSRFRKDPKFYDRISFRNTSLGFLDPHTHRVRHTALVNAAFSPSRVRGLAWIVEEKVEKLLDRFELSCEAGEPVNIHKGCKALTIDIISHIAMSQDFGCI